jgi:murein DD-endopeptidase MepM/ murein hydrolase activator NlpD
MIKTKTLSLIFLFLLSMSSFAQKSANEIIRESFSSDMEKLAELMREGDKKKESAEDSEIVDSSSEGNTNLKPEKVETIFPDFEVEDGLDDENYQNFLSSGDRSHINRDSADVVDKYLPKLELAFNSVDIDQISSLIDDLLKEEYIPEVLVDTLRGYSVFVGLASKTRRDYLIASEGVSYKESEMIDRVNSVGDYGILPHWELYGDSVAYKSSRRWEIRGKIRPSYYKESRNKIIFPYTMHLLARGEDYHPPIKIEDMSVVNSLYSRNRYHPVDKRYKPHKGVDMHSKNRKGKNPDYVYNEYLGVVRVRKNDPQIGYTIVVRDKNGGETTYPHLAQFADVIPGDTLYPGDIVGRIGETGSKCTGPHLHHEFNFVGLSINPSYLTNLTKFIQVPKSANKQRQKQTLEAKEDLAKWHNHNGVGELCSHTIIISKPGVSKPGKNPFICQSTDGCVISIPGRDGSVYTVLNLTNAVKP